MKTRRCFALLLALMLVLTGCAANAAEEEKISGDTAGADWRTWGWVNDAGTLTRDGEETDVLVCVFSDSIMLYLDDETQTVVGAAEYPETLEDAREAYVSVSLDDQDGDGYSDLRAVFASPSGEETVLNWLWDAESGAFVCQPDSKGHAPRKAAMRGQGPGVAVFLRTQGKCEGAAKKIFCGNFAQFFNDVKLKRFKTLNPKII